MSDCPHPDKVSYPSRAAARKARRVLHWGRVRPYRCVCGGWHLGTVAGSVRRGTALRHKVHR
jgi:hypothetical protein